MLGIEWEVVDEEIEIEFDSERGEYAVGWLDEIDLMNMLQALRREKEKNAKID